MTKIDKILYPRFPGEFKMASQSTRDIQINKRLDEILNSTIIKEFNNLNQEASRLHDRRKKFVCGNCGHEESINQLTLYRFISYRNNMDEDRYDDDNIVCNKCGKFNCWRDKGFSAYGFKEVKEIFE